jgi:hypothetical protein
MEDQNGTIYVNGETEGIDSFFGSGIIARIFPDELLSSEELDGADLGIRAYPNPFSDQLNLAFNDRNMRVKQIQIFSSEGRLVKLFREDQSSGTQRTLSLSDLPKGLYLMSVETNRGRQVIKVVK